MRRLLCDLADVPDGHVKAIQLEGLPELAVANVEGAFHVFEALCSHGASSLAEGRLLGCEVECVLHKGRFDVTTGKATRRPAKKPIAVYPSVVEDGQLFLESDIPAEAVSAAGR
ncbi:non-heme iron oxygenase ferredoxin subunit [Geodermatophilus ruber]|uniref:3-phenylpropionate/trans-cinnamate dioxygenase ferredoxin subunit n=1 Tax=Geodermatophilus ruber TaxID=504800 RepID=A0A1I4H520_9ACTN|nr:non-heme iron oxygenase ferredoxin subunit [Geodermatophilus ruber]SFL36753.1 3-phenylpropionate/trans-cinnamate dioxygenase ferredoxin subunit [Geodermatophilus ruber]